MFKVICKIKDIESMELSTFEEVKRVVGEPMEDLEYIITNEVEVIDVTCKECDIKYSESIFYDNNRDYNSDNFKDIQKEICEELNGTSDGVTHKHLCVWCNKLYEKEQLDITMKVIKHYRLKKPWGMKRVTCSKCYEESLYEEEFNKINRERYGDSYVTLEEERNMRNNGGHTKPYHKHYCNYCDKEYPLYLFDFEG